MNRPSETQCFFPQTQKNVITISRTLNYNVYVFPLGNSWATSGESDTSSLTVVSVQTQIRFGCILQRLVHHLNTICHYSYHISQSR